MKLAGDCTVGGLVKWLRVLGYDTRYYPGPADDTCFELCRRQGRILLSRNTKLARKGMRPPVIILRENDPKDQLRQVVKSLGLKPEQGCFLSRCIRCNGRLRRVDRNTVHGLVPDYVWATQRRFSCCERCGRVYWPGTHVTRFRRTVDGLFSDRKDGV